MRQNLKSAMAVLNTAGGFSLPLLAVVAAEALWGTILLLPSPLNAPGVKLSQLAATRNGTTIGESTLLWASNCSTALTLA